MRNMSLGERIRIRRKELELTAEGLAKKVSVDRTYISKIERHGFLPSLEVFKSIDKILDLGPDFGKRYIQEKYPDFGEVLKRAIQEGPDKDYLARENSKLANLPPDVREINSRLASFLSIGKEADTYPFVTKLLKEYNPSQADNDVLIGKIVKWLKRMRKESKDFSKAFQQKEIDLVSLIKAAV